MQFNVLPIPGEKFVELKINQNLFFFFLQTKNENSKFLKCELVLKINAVRFNFGFPNPGVVAPKEFSRLGHRKISTN